MYDELRQHPEWHFLLANISREVDKAKDSVLTEVRRNNSSAAERAVGRHDTLLALLQQLRGEG